MRKITVSDIIEMWPSAEIMADDLALKYRSHARVMKVRGRIPQQHWPRLLSAAMLRNIPLTERMLEEAHK
jgi:hypothetical protein